MRHMKILLVLDGSTGQNAFEQAKQFTCGYRSTAWPLNKLDGTAKVRGGNREYLISIKIRTLQRYRRRY
jgi:signal recognition particle GTPase